jgi:FkbM family methyltransferase
MLPDLIYDVGMNNGDDTAYYLHRGYRVVAIEANPELAAAGERRFEKQIGEGRLKILNVALTESGEVLPFWICETRSEWSSFDRAIASRDGSPHHAVHVPCRQFRSIMDEHGVPYYLKVDIEGNDRLCLEALTADDLPVYLSFEMEQEASERSFSLLRELGYDASKCISQFQLLPIELPPSKEQRRVELIRKLRSTAQRSRLAAFAMSRLGITRWWTAELERFRERNGWTFAPGSSGPFGEETPGRWHTPDELMATLTHYDELRKRGKTSPFWTKAPYSYWADLHFRRPAPESGRPIQAST